MSIKEKANHLSKTLRLDSHHATERFGIITAFFLVTLLVLVASVAISVTNSHRAEASAMALYTPTFTTSKTNLSGNVNGVYVSEDRTRAFIFMTFVGSSASAVSANADNYQAFMTGSTSKLSQESLQSNIDGEVVVFGSTGHLGIILDSDEPFSPQILNITMRANSELAHSQSDEANLRVDLQGDKSFLDYDQWRIYVNPGAEEAIETSALAPSSEPVSLGGLYYDLVLADAEAQARTALDNALSQMRVDLAKIDEYTRQAETTSVLGGVKLLPVEVPRVIAGDQVTGALGDEENPLTLHTNWVPANGYNFDWRSGSIATGYLDTLVPSGTSVAQYLSDKAAKPTSEQSLKVRDIEWVLTDGTNLNEIDRSAAQTYAPLTSVMNNLTQVYQSYHTQKNTYQTTLYGALLSLEIELKNVQETMTVNDSDDSLFTY